MEVLKSDLDESVNFVTDIEGFGKFEHRFVHRPGSDYFIAYVSSYTGCNLACRMCHLTATGQTGMYTAYQQDLLNQVQRVVEYSQKHVPYLKKMHVNFMARGEPLVNPFVYEAGYWSGFVGIVKNRYPHLEIKFIISTIMPQDMIDREIPCEADMAVYYSLYSVEPSFRRRWLPKAMHPIHAMSKLKRWQDRCPTGIVKVHHPLILNENDSIADAHRVVDLIEYSGIKASINLIRYNPPNEKSQETYESRLERVLAVYQNRLPGSKMVSRVGEDVFASCGMFVNG